MKNRHQINSEGQALIQVAVTLLFLLLILALAIDVGFVYGERRHMQNAADAGALAGAQELCFGSGDQGLAQAAAWNYAVDRNGAQTADISFEGPDNNIVAVTANIPANTFFANLMGISQVAVSARAKAACGVATSACGLWPVAFRQDSWNFLSTQCGREFVLWASGSVPGQPSDTIAGVDCSVYDCDVFKSSGPPGDSDILQGDSRAWIDFSSALPPYQDEAPCDQGGCGANELGCWILHDSGAKIEKGDCVGGDTGVKAGVKNDVDARQGDIIKFPVFDSECAGSGTGACAGKYHVADFGCAQVVGWIQNLDIVPLDPLSNAPTVHSKVIHVKVSCDSSCDTECGSTDGSGGLPGTGEVGAVSLIE